MNESKQNNSYLTQLVKAMLAWSNVIVTCSIYISVSLAVMVWTLTHYHTDASLYFPVILCAIPLAAAGLIPLLYILTREASKLSPPTVIKIDPKKSVPIYRNGKKVDSV